jgi:hypothetical protein
MKYFNIILVVVFLSLSLGACQKGSVDTPQAQGSALRAVRIDYPDLSPASALTVDEEQALKSANITLVGVGTGRVDWSFFPWEGHRSNWANAVRESGVDFLARDVNRFGTWAEVTAVVDVLAPLYIQAHPDSAAVAWGGEVSNELVSLTQMTEGDFSAQLLSFVEAISKTTKAKSITIVELFYYVDGFGTDDLVSFRAYNGSGDWPRLPTGEIDINAQPVANWRADRLVQLLSQAAEIAHANDKLLYVEVKPDPPQLEDQDWRAYDDYLKVVDKLIVMSNPIFSKNDSVLAADTIHNLNSLGVGKIIYELGLWQDDDRSADVQIAMRPDAFSALYQTAVNAGVNAFWFTPNYLITSEYWQALADN